MKKEVEDEIQVCIEREKTRKFTNKPRSVQLPHPNSMLSNYFKIQKNAQCNSKLKDGSNYATRVLFCTTPNLESLPGTNQVSPEGPKKILGLTIAINAKIIARHTSDNQMQILIAYRKVSKNLRIVASMSNSKLTIHLLFLLNDRHNSLLPQRHVLRSELLIVTPHNIHVLLNILWYRPICLLAIDNRILSHC